MNTFYKGNDLQIVLIQIWLKNPVFKDDFIGMATYSPKSENKMDDKHVRILQYEVVL